MILRFWMNYGAISLNNEFNLNLFKYTIQIKKYYECSNKQKNGMLIIKKRKYQCLTIVWEMLNIIYDEK